MKEKEREALKQDEKCRKRSEIIIEEDSNPPNPNLIFNYSLI